LNAANVSKLWQPRQKTMNRSVAFVLSFGRECLSDGEKYSDLTRFLWHSHCYAIGEIVSMNTVIPAAHNRPLIPSQEPQESPSRAQL
jgi:hypothetical protein